MSVAPFLSLLVGLRPSVWSFGVSWGLFGRPLGFLGRFFGHSWCLLGSLEGSSEGLWEYLGQPGAPKGHLDGSGGGFL